MAHADIFKEIQREYETERNAALALRDRRRAALYKAQPRLHAIDQQLMENGLFMARLALGLGHDTAAVRTTAETLAAEKAAILAKEGIPEDYLTDVFRCAICEDTGYTHKQEPNPVCCTCLKQRLINKCYSLSNLGDVLAKENFGTFKLNHFSQTVLENEGLSPRDNMKALRRISERFTNPFAPGADNLLFYGTTGLGKTFLCHCIAKAVLDAGYTVLYVTAPRLFKLIQDNHFNRGGAPYAEEQLNAVHEADLLVLDDLGAEFSTIVTDSALFDVLNQRLLENRSTVISTNLTTDELEEQYTERIVSRFIGNYKWFKFFGDDLRVKRAERMLEE